MMKHAPEKQRPIRVLYCILDNRFGGPHRLAMAVARRLREHGVETLFLLGRKTEDLWRPEGFEWFQCRHIQCFARRRPIWNLVRFCCLLPYHLLTIRRIIRAQRIDVVHVTGVTNFVPALAASLTRTPIVWLYNDHLLGPLKRILLPLLTRLAATVIVQGENLRDDRTGSSPRLRRKTVVLHPGIDIRLFDPARFDTQMRVALRAQLGIPADCPLVGMIGNMNRFKGHAYFLRAAQQIKEQIPNAKFIVVGRKLDTDPGYWEQMQRLTAECGLQDEVIYTGFRDDIPGILSILDVFVLSSILESCPNVVLEAMAMKVPVVATNVGAITEQVVHGRTGILVPPADAVAIADAVVSYLRKPRAQIEAMLQAARARVTEVFSLSETVGRQKILYEELVTGHR